jgi:glycosyltransferase involved in cell wall biosynthesis
MGGEGWLGGSNYYRNLFSALKSLEEPRIEAVLLVRAGQESVAQLLSPYAARRRLPSLLDVQTGRPARRIARAAPLSWALWRGFLAVEGIQLLSHSPATLPRAMMPSVGWVYDLQHRELPDLFSARECRDRDHAFDALCRSSTAVLVSSETARCALEKHFPRCASRARVLRFVANVAVTAPTSVEALRRKYHLPDAYFYLPNQFWRHKNHVTVVQALADLKHQRKETIVVATGAATDFRHPDYFATLTDMVKSLELEHHFRMLGVVPYEDLLGLMRGCIAVLNPSLYEGWSTTVEEAKSLGKQVVLSSIPVHVEQDPERGLYFDAMSAMELADRLTIAAEGFSTDAEQRFMERAKAALAGRVRSFGLAYQEIALQAVDGS